jgi:hypothetical protein
MASNPPRQPNYLRLDVKIVRALRVWKSGYVRVRERLALASGEQPVDDVEELRYVERLREVRVRARLE